METPIEKALETFFKNQQKSFGSTEKNILHTIHSKQDPWPIKLIANGLVMNIEIVNGFKCFVVKEKKAKPTNKKVMFIHGGAFIGEISQAHWLYIKTLIKKTQTTVYVPIYPLTNDKYSSQIDTVRFLVDLYREITKENKDDVWSLVGDSAGGGFALILAQQIKIHKLKKPKNLILISPSISLMNSPELEKIGGNDPILTYNLLKTVMKWQLKEQDPKNPLFSPIYGDSKDIGDIHIFVGDRDILMHFVREWIRRLDKEGIKYSLDIKKEMFHDYPIFLIGKNVKETNEKIYQIINS